MLALRYAFATLTASFLAVGSLSAGILNVVNSSFEASTGYNGGNPGTIPGWSAAAFGGTFGQVENDTTLFTAGLSGNNATYLNGGITQTIPTTFVTGATYTLTVDIGNPLTVGPTGASLTFGFRNAVNNAFTGSGFISNAAETAIPDGTFQTFTTTYTALASDNGNPIIIGMTDFFSGDTNYRLDNVTLSTSVPEPSTYVGGIFLFVPLLPRGTGPGIALEAAFPHHHSFQRAPGDGKQRKPADARRADRRVAISSQGADREPPISRRNRSRTHRLISQGSATGTGSMPRNGR